MQNTIIREFEDNPHVVAVTFNQAGARYEDQAWLEIFWSNYYLRGGILFDELSAVGAGAYGQPDTGLPFGRGFIIDHDGYVVHPYFGYQPKATIARIYELLGAGAVPDGRDVPGVGLVVAKAGGGAIALSWGASCQGRDDDYEVYEGGIGDFTSHAPAACSTGGQTSASFVPSAEDSYYLVVPRRGAYEGSYGRASDGTERPASAQACREQLVSACP
jgi:hypothetical protein